MRTTTSAWRGTPSVGRPPKGAAVARPGTMAEIHAALRARAVWVVIALLALLIWSYWPTLMDLRAFWNRNEDYSAGQLVPPVLIYLVWRRRHDLAACRLTPCWWGLGIVLGSQLLRAVGIYYAFGSLERLALVLTASGCLLWVGGTALWRRLLWEQAFLLLMLPPPVRVHDQIAMPLQNWATGLSRAGLELLGFYVAREGNVLQVEERGSVMVAEACSGLRMLTAFVFTAAFLCFLARRPAWHKIVVCAASLPVAVLCNALRVLATTLFFQYSQSTVLEEQFHDAAGLAMMPLAVVLLLGVLKLLNLFSELAQPEAVVPARHDPVRAGPPEATS